MKTFGQNPVQLALDKIRSVLTTLQSLSSLPLSHWRSKPTLMATNTTGAGAATASATRSLHPSCTCIRRRNHIFVRASARDNETRLAFPVARRKFISTMLSSLALSPLAPIQLASAEPALGFREYIDNFDGYTFLYPKSWIRVRGSGADVFFRDPLVLDENISVEISSPSSSRYASVTDLGSPEKAAEKVLRQYLTEFMSTRLGIRRESNVLSASQRVADDGKIYYQVEDRVQKLEWDRRYLSVLGVENKRLYELRLQTPEKVFEEEEKDLREVMNSFRAFKAID